MEYLLEPLQHQLHLPRLKAVFRFWGKHLSPHHQFYNFHCEENIIIINVTHSNF